MFGDSGSERGRTAGPVDVLDVDVDLDLGVFVLGRTGHAGVVAIPASGPAVSAEYKLAGLDSDDRSVRIRVGGSFATAATEYEH